MSVYLNGNILHYNGSDYYVGDIPKETVEYLVENFGKTVKNKLNLEGKLIGLKSGTFLYDFGWYKLVSKDPVYTIPKGVWTRYGNVYYNSFLLLQGRKEPSAKCLKCGKLVTGTFQDLDRHTQVCKKRDLADRVDHTWKYYGTLKYYGIEDRERAKEKKL